eukprot:TRINITY_DN27443_c0_g1_i1.p1 TRINITY_DN27443_c0_g1~~TRINITY_DN27443_c0_g1_i1.p1  ORF type:complete len:327 (+),score=91.37 TRINITY_DN27443_c0_g1_i1:53-1033(+)
MGKKRKGASPRASRHAGRGDPAGGTAAAGPWEWVQAWMAWLAAVVLHAFGVEVTGGTESAGTAEEEEEAGEEEPPAAPEETPPAARGPPGACGVRYKRSRKKTCGGVCYVLRHGERIDHVNKGLRLANRDDPALSAVGLRQARDSAAALAALPAAERPVAVFASPFHRTLQTANEIATRLNIPLLVEPGLGEYLNKGQFKAQPKLPLPTAEAWPQLDLSYAPLQRTLSTYPEKEADCRARFASVLAALVDANPQAHIAAVTHRFGVQSIIEDGLAARRAGLVTNVPYCSLTALERRVVGGVKEWSYRGKIADASHLSDIRGIYFKR